MGSLSMIPDGLKEMPRKRTQTGGGQYAQWRIAITWRSPQDESMRSAKFDESITRWNPVDSFL